MRPPTEVNPLIKDSESTPITEQAAAWFLRMQQSNCNANDQAEFQAWLEQNETHRVEYQKYLQLWQRLDHLDYRPASSTRESANLNIIWVLFLSVLTTVLVWAINYEETIQTAIGERQQMVFNDGTVIELNTDTELHVTPFGWSRKFTLRRGEVLFKVGEHSLRSFTVDTGNGVLQDIGTEFNVVKEGDKTTVAVLQGVVEIRLKDQANQIKTLHGGQQAHFSSTEISAITPVDVEAITAWQKSRLIFRETPLHEVVLQINRYHAKPLVLGGDKQLQHIKVSGEFNANNRDGMIQSLKKLFPLQNVEQQEATVLLYSAR